MSNGSNVPAYAADGRFDFTVRSTDDNVSISRPVSREDIEKVRRQLAEWERRRSRHRQPT